jgi:hypothetical protein
VDRREQLVVLRQANTTMKIPDYQIDAFTDKPFSWNPAAV